MLQRFGWGLEEYCLYLLHLLCLDFSTGTHWKVSCGEKSASRLFPYCLQPLLATWQDQCSLGVASSNETREIYGADMIDMMILDNEGFGYCSLCGEYVRLTRDGWCEDCDKATADDAIASIKAGVDGLESDLDSFLKSHGLNPEDIKREALGEETEDEAE